VPKRLIRPRPLRVRLLLMLLLTALLLGGGFFAFEPAECAHGAVDDRVSGQNHRHYGSEPRGTRRS
jgi:hypothetical protein